MINSHNKVNTLFFNHTQQNCGVHEYGRLLSEKLASSEEFNLTYIEVSSEGEFVDQCLRNSSASLCFINYHPLTLPWLKRNHITGVGRAVIGIMHEFDYQNAFYEGSRLFDFRALIDPSVKSRVPNVSVHPRVITGCRPLTKPRNDFTVGSFGFGTPSKRFDHVVKLVKREFDVATIRFNIPAAAFGDPYGTEARKIASICSDMVSGTSIRIEVTHDFLSPQTLVDFLAENTINLFCYTDEKGRGISSAVDFAIASGRPFGVSDGTMFRHLKHICPEVFISKNGIRKVLESEDRPAKKLQVLWSDKNLSRSFFNASINAIASYKAFSGKNKFYNIALDDTERQRYSNDIEEMKRTVPEIMSKKIAEANVQQAFVKSAVEHFSEGKKDLNILCIGSYEDTAYETLIKKGYLITAIDPVINSDLNEYFKKETTVKSAYDIIFSTSVIEHVQDDELFISQITNLLAENGVAILTADFNDGFREGDVKPHTDCRLYTIKDILLRLVPRMQSCELVGPHFWQACVPDFSFEGATYSFVSLVFRKKKELPDDKVFSNDIRRELHEIQYKQSRDKKPVFLRRLERSIRKRRKRVFGWINNFNQQRDNAEIVENARNEVTHNKPSFLRRLGRSIRKRRNRLFGLINNYNQQTLNIDKSQNGPNEIILNSDYGIDSNEWQMFRKKLLETLNKNKSTSTSKNQKLWICFLESNEVAKEIDINKESNIQKIIHNGIISAGCIIISGKKTISSSFKAMGVKIVENIQQAEKLINEEDVILFISEKDNLEPAIIQILEKNDVFSAELLLFDFYYEQESQSYPVLLHGVDSLHARYCDYFFSRFMVKGRLLTDAIKKCKKVTPRNISLACFDLAEPSKIKHIPIPLLSVGLTREMVQQAKSKITHRKKRKRAHKGQVSAIICTKDNNFLLQQLMHRLRNEGSIKEIIIVANNCTSKNMELFLRELKETRAAQIIRYDKAFNFSNQCNIASSIATGTNLLFLNDDIAPSSENWIENLIESSTTNTGSISGPLLIYPDQTVQHGGMFIGFRNIAGHMLRHSSIPDATSNFLLNAPRKVSCLTGAVLMIPRTVFDNLKGFDENLGTYLQDVDLCLRATEIEVDLVFDPRSVLVHFESTTVKAILPNNKIQKTRQREYDYFRSRWPNLKDNYFNKNLSLDDEQMKKLRIQ
jgi:GT2 family glycosyltransferase/SAM-dependent methyltransferase